MPTENDANGTPVTDEESDASRPAGFEAWIKTSWVPILGAVLFALTVSCILKALNATPDDALAKFCVIAAIPLLSLGIGILTSRFFHDLSTKEALRRDVQMAAYTTYHLRSSVLYVDQRVEFAIALLLQNLEESPYNAYALLHLVSAKTATELAFGMTQQSGRQFEMISAAGATAAKDIFNADKGEAPPKIKLGDQFNAADAGGGDDGHG